MRNPSPIHALLLASASLAAAVAAHAQTAPAAGAPTSSKIASAATGTATTATASAQPVAGDSASGQAQAQPASGTGTTSVVAAQPDQLTDAIVVTGRRFENVARLQQKDAINLVNIQSAQEIAKYPDFNAAEALERVPGVSISSDTGEGRFVNIRGIDGNLDGTTFGGVQLLNTQPGGTSFGGGGRAVELDTIPIGAVDQLIVRKTGLPDQEAEGLGGSVDIIPRTAQGIKKSFLEGEIGGGYQPLHGHAGIYRGVLAGGYRFGPDKAFGIEINGSYHEDGRAVDDVEPAYLDATPPSPTNKVLSSVELRRYNYNRRRFGFGSELTYDPSPQHHFYIRADNAGYTERVNRQRLIYGNLGNPNADGSGDPLVADASGTFVAPNANATLTLRDEEETHLNFVTALGGHSDFEKVIVDYQGSYTAATYHKYYDHNTSFNSSIANFPLTYNNNTITGLPAIVPPTGFNPSDPTQFTLGGVQNQSEGAHDREWAGRIDLTVPLHLIGTEETIKFGGKLRLRDKNDFQYNYTYFQSTKADGTINNPQLPVQPALPLTSVLGPGPYTNFYSGQYDIGYAPGYLKLRSAIYDNPSYRSGALINRNELFVDTENVYAGYVEYQGKLNKFGYLIGVRIENTDGTYRSPDLGGATDAAGNPLILAGKSNYTDFFPTVQLRFDFTDKLVARFNYSTAIGRPGFEQLQNGLNPNYGGPSLTVGNPALKPTTDNAFDVSLQYYLPHSGILSVSVFDKEFDSYIITNFATLPGAQVNALYGTAAQPLTFAATDQVRVSGQSNIKNSYARGIEAEYAQKLSFLPAPFDGFGISANVTYVDSTIELHPGVNTRLPGTSTLTWNMAGYYEAHGVQVRLAADWVSPSIFGAGGSSVTDYYQDTKFQVDLTSSYQITKQVSAYFNARNLFNGPLRYYEGYSTRPGQREFYDQSYEAGVRFAF